MLTQVKHLGQRLLLWVWKTMPIPRRLRWLVLWLFNTKFLVGVVAVSFDDQERVLLVRHTYRPRHPWGLPGGAVGRNEAMAAAMARELAEETGWQFAVEELFQVRNSSRRPHLDLYFLCTPLGGTFRANAEIDALEFFPLDALPALIPSQYQTIALGLQRHRERRLLRSIGTERSTE